jgi:AMMECR1 domain-containing protein
MPITKEEAPFVIPIITMLTPFKKVKSYKDITLGLHGIILKNGSKQAVFLPQVAVEQGWDLPTTLEQLSLKAGLNKHAWKNKETTFEICEGYEIN